MQFNSDVNKGANEVIFSRKRNESFHTPVAFNNKDIKKYPHHLDIVLDSKLDFKFHVDQKIQKCNKLIGLIKRLSVSVPRKALLTIYKSFIRPHLHYGDILHDKPENENFQNKLEVVQYRACLAITGAIQRTSRQKLYDELGLHSLSKRRWRNKLIVLCKILNGFLPKYLYLYLTFPSQENYPLRSALTNKINFISSRTKPFFYTIRHQRTSQYSVVRLSTQQINALNQGIIKFAISFLQKSGHFDKPLISFNQ